MADPILPSSTSSGLVGVQNVTNWYNLPTWTVNITRYAPSLEDIVRAGPRMFMKLGSFVASSESFNPAATQQFAGSLPANSDPLRSYTVHTNLQNAMESGSSVGADADPISHVSRLSVDGARGLGSVFSYATSKWAISCIAMAIILNRTHIFAATRRRSRFRWHIRAILRILPVLLLLIQARSLLQSIQCQTSPDFSLLRWGNASRTSDLMFSHENTVLNTLGSALLLGATDEQSCTAVAMTPSLEDVPPQELRGSLSTLWPLFGTFCLSHFLETLSCAVQGRPIAAETGMTLFEQSLAFAEADAAVSNQLGWGSFSNAQPANGTSIALTRSMIMKRVNTSPEVLLVALLSAMSHISSHVLGIFDLQAKYRLVNTGLWGLSFMASIVWSVFTFNLDEPATQGLLRYPTVCIIGFVPHVLVLCGILVCSCIYSLALVISAWASSSNPEFASMTFRQRIAHAHENMQANVSLSEIRINREMDFYTALLRTGFAAITMASEAVYLNEDRGVSLKQHTWLEEARLREAEEMHKQWIGMGLPSSKYDQIGAIGLIPVKGGPLGASNGYARERAAQKVPKGRERGGRAGIGATERSSRWLMALEFVLSINKLIAKLFAIAALRILALLRIRSQPAWLLWLAHRPKPSKNGESAAQETAGRSVAGQSNAVTEGGPSSAQEGLDVEAEFRRVDNDQDDEVLDRDLYNYWLKGGWWGSNDSSGDFTPDQEDDWDTTSIISMSTYSGETDAEEKGWESEDSGQKTPTPLSPRTSRQSTPAVDSPLHIGDLARLLHPQNPEEREEASRLSAHFQSERIMTRSQFRRIEQLKRTKVLTVTPPRTGQTTSIGRPAKLSPEDEERLLEQLLLSRRQTPSHKPEEAAQWQQGAAGMGGDGPQCVVCQCSPRTVIVWPCRCLSLCDDCRVSLAMNNFDKCVCCRREVISFSRIFVP